MKKNNNVDLVNGHILQGLLRLSLPIMSSSFIRLLYSMTDMFWVGGLGHEALAAVGSAGLLLCFTEGIAMIFCMGGQTNVGHSFGRDIPEDALSFAREALRMALLSAVVLFLIGFCSARQLVGVFKFNSDITFNDTVIYLRIVSTGLFFTFGERMMNALFIVTGDSRTPFIVNAIGLGLNMLLDPFMIRVLNLGVGGAALATVISQIVVFGVVLFLFRRNTTWSQVNIFVRHFDKNAVHLIFKIGTPVGLRAILFAMITVFISRMVVAFGDMSVAIQRLGAQVESISWMTADGFAMAVNAFIAQNFGAGQGARVRKVYKTSMYAIFCVSLLTTAVLYFWAAPITSLFLQDPAGILQGRDYLKILSLSQWMMCVEIITNSAFAGLGQSAFPAAVSVTCVALRIPLGNLLAQTYGVTGIWWALTLTSICSGSILLVSFIIYLRRLYARGVLTDHPQSELA